MLVSRRGEPSRESVEVVLYPLLHFDICLLDVIEFESHVSQGAGLCLIEASFPRLLIPLLPMTFRTGLTEPVRHT